MSLTIYSLFYAVLWVTVQPPSFAPPTSHQLQKDANCPQKCARYPCGMHKRASKGTDVEEVLNSSLLLWNRFCDNCSKSMTAPDLVQKRNSTVFFFLPRRKGNCADKGNEISTLQFKRAIINYPHKAGANKKQGHGPKILSDLFFLL